MEIATKPNRFILYARLMRLDKPIGIYLLLWPTLWGLWIAGNGSPDPILILIFTLGVILMRSAGCVINDYVDRKIDRLIQRTKDRPITSGLVGKKEALLLFSGLGLTAFMLVLFLNPLTIALSFVGIFLAASYPLMKRYTHLPQIYLGVAFAWAIPMTFTAQTGMLDIRLWLLFITTLCWTVIYDTMYAMADRAEDLKIGVKSTAILFGKYDRLIIALLQLFMLIMLIVIGISFELSAIYFSSLSLVITLGIYHQWLIKDRLAPRCFQAFLHNHWIGLVILLGIILDYVI